MSIASKYLEIINLRNKANKSKNRIYYIWKARHRKFEIIKELKNKNFLTIEDIRNCILIIQYYINAFGSEFTKKLHIIDVWSIEDKSYYKKTVYINRDKSCIVFTFNIYINRDHIDIDSRYHYAKGNLNEINTHKTIEQLDSESFISMILIEDVKTVLSNIIKGDF